MAQAARRYLGGLGFIEVETPILTKSTPEGARDFLVPSRLRAGEFYALPQSPQLFKQLLMIAGFERYYQIARAFRDEDLRADRQPEHTQIDIEMSFVDEEDIQKMVEGMFAAAFKEALAVDLKTPFPRMTYADAMALYGSDKPDLRFDMQIVDVTELAGQMEFRVFADAVGSAGEWCADTGPRAVPRSRARTSTTWLRRPRCSARKGSCPSGSKSRAYARRCRSSSPRPSWPTWSRGWAVNPEICCFWSRGTKKVVEPSLGALRLSLATRLGIKREGWAFSWILDFPMFEFDEKEGRLKAQHHPFTKPRLESLDDLAGEASGTGHLRLRSSCLNGVELGSGSLRISDPRLQEAVFAALGLD